MSWTHNMGRELAAAGAPWLRMEREENRQRYANAQQRLDQRLLETVADIAYLAGAQRYHSGDSREDVSQFIEWAREFETLRQVDDAGTETYRGKNYLDAIEDYVAEKLRA